MTDDLCGCRDSTCTSHKVARRCRNYSPHRLLSDTGRCCCSGLVICIEPGTKYRTVADSSGKLECDSASRTGCGQVSITIKSESTYCIGGLGEKMLEDLWTSSRQVRKPLALQLAQSFLPSLHPIWNTQVRLR